MNLFSKFTKGLEKTRSGLLGSVGKLLKGRSALGEEELEEIEELLIAGDVGPELSELLLERLREAAGSSSGDLLDVLRKEVEALLDGVQREPVSWDARPHVVMVVGVNGSGKTTTIGKLAARYTREGKKVLLAAADTFRAAAGDQLEIWAERAGAQIVRSKPGADPAAVAFDAVQAGQSRGLDVVIIDTAGRLHTKKNLMEELRKVHRVIGKAMPGAPHEVLLVLDATVGQNALAQARHFAEAVGVTGLVGAKLDGTAKGGAILPVVHELGIPPRYVGVGEGVDDLVDFDPKAFAEALFA